MGAAKFGDYQEHVQRVIQAVVAAADPARALERNWVDPPSGPVLLLAIGKASLEMCAAATRNLAGREVLGVVTAVPERIGTVEVDPRVGVYPADHPLPTQRNVEAARMVAAAVRMFAEGRDAQGSGTLVALVSGGGSAHLTLPAEGLTLEDLRVVSSALQRAGAPIHDLNTVRKHTELLKGGRLAALAAPVPVLVYLVSDVLGDRLDVIASGPFAPDPTTYADALAVLDRFGARNAAPAVTHHLVKGTSGAVAETPKPGDGIFAGITTRVIAGNGSAVEAAAVELRKMGFQIAGVRTGVDGEAADAGRMLARRAIQLSAGSGAGAFVLGGETTVRVDAGGGRGGPSQELALAAAVELEHLDKSPPGRVIADRTAILTFSTDGVDGPTDAAGAQVTAETLRRLRSLGIDPSRALMEHDTHTALDRAGALIRTGPTGTNVNHVAAVLVYPA